MPESCLVVSGHPLCASVTFAERYRIYVNRAAVRRSPNAEHRQVSASLSFPSNHTLPIAWRMGACRCSCLLPAACCLLPAACCFLMPAASCLLPAACCLSLAATSCLLLLLLLPPLTGVHNACCCCCCCCCCCSSLPLPGAHNVKRAQPLHALLAEPTRGRPGVPQMTVGRKRRHGPGVPQKTVRSKRRGRPGVPQRTVRSKRRGRPGEPQRTVGG